MMENFISHANPLFLTRLINSFEGDVYVVDKTFRLVWVSTDLENKMRNNGVFDVIGKYCYSTLWDNKKPCEHCPAFKVVETGRKKERAEVGQLAHGKHIIISVSSTLLKAEEGSPDDFMVQMARDITARKEDENELIRLADLYRAIVEYAPTCISTLDKHGIFTSVNPAMLSTLGLSKNMKELVIGFNWLENAYTIRSGLADYVKRSLKGESIVIQEFPFITFHGDKKLFLDFHLIPMRGRDNLVEGLLVIVDEITEKVNIRSRLIQETRKATIAKLAMGIAHALNNPLASIAAYSELAAQRAHLLKVEFSLTDYLKELNYYLTVIHDETFRCKRIANSLFKLGSSRNLENEDIDLVVVIDEILGFMDFRKKNISISKSFPKRLPYVQADLSMLKQVLWIVITNAIDSLEKKDGGKIRLTGRMAEVKRVLVSVDDNGEGISEADMDKIFEPFYTTKTADKGTGLGLSLVREFVEKMGGSIEVRSKQGKGTVFSITLLASATKEKSRRHHDRCPSR
jgi:PAS domain S-box-containing protein